MRWNFFTRHGFITAVGGAQMAFNKRGLGSQICACGNPAAFLSKESRPDAEEYAECFLCWSEWMAEVAKYGKRASRAGWAEQLAAKRRHGAVVTEAAAYEICAECRDIYAQFAASGGSLPAWDIDDDGEYVCWNCGERLSRTERV
jgi:hypothetical protein